MKLLFPFYFFIFAFISVKQNYSGNEVLTKDSNEPSIICPCHPQYAGTDKFTCSAAPAESVVIGCNDGGSVDCADLCYLWAPALGLGNGDLGKKNPTVSPTTTTTYTLTVTNTKTGDVVSTTSMTVYVVHLELILYTPCVIATNNTTPASLTLGAQTFVNLDNDDQDTYFDNDALESSTNGVNPAGGGGDDELVRAELRVTPIGIAMLPSNLGRLIATSGATNIKVWQNSLKMGPEYVLNTDFALTPQVGGVLTADLWIEGVTPHTVQQGTKLKMSYQGIDCMTSASLTIIGVQQLSWEGAGNSFLNNNVLDGDPNFMPPGVVPATWPTAFRIFPDARVADPITGIFSTPLNTAVLKVELSVTPVEPVNLYVRSFDMDDPTNNTVNGLGDPNFLNFVDPNDAGGNGMYNGTPMTYTVNDDNRTNGTKAGTFNGQVGNTASIGFTNASKTAMINFINISMQPGDNYRALVNGDKDFLDDLENLDSRDGHKIVNISVTPAGVNPLEVLFPFLYCSPVLTIWRFLNFEGDSMGDGLPGTDLLNSTTAVFRDFDPNNSIQNLTNSFSDLRQTYDDFAYDILDPSSITSDPAPCTGTGRFQNGTVEPVVLGFAPPNAMINSNTDRSINLAAPLNLTGLACTFTAPGRTGTARLTNSPTKIINPAPAGGFFYTWNLNNIVLVPATSTLANFIGGEFKINSSINVPITGANAALSTLQTSKFGLRVKMKDDDALPSARLPFMPPSADLVIYRNAYLEVNNLGPLKSIPPPFDINIGDDMFDFAQVAVCNETVGRESPNYWCVHAISSWQGHLVKDADGSIISGAGCPPVGVLLGYELNALAGLSEPAILHDTSIAVGGDESFVFRETLREFPMESEANVVAHEIGHQFGLTHGDLAMPNIPECCGSLTMGLMSSSPGPGGNKLIPRHQNLIRSRIQSPGH